MDAARWTLTAAALLCSLTAGILLSFAVVVMPGIRSLHDAAFVRAFQVMDGIIQDNQPLFVLVWVGSAVALAAALVVALPHLAGADRMLLVAAAGFYFLGVQAPTVGINIPMNNTVQRVAVDVASDDELRAARRAFESRWNRWNVIRTALAVLTS